ncbi:unnamed protein product [Amoebophrya sp. A120]|nr:unnamed protein product [Amoebophrya sp. A120]|eukprot:GSA120T00022882001.1
MSFDAHKMIENSSVAFLFAEDANYEEIFALPQTFRLEEEGAFFSRSAMEKAMNWEPGGADFPALIEKVRAAAGVTAGVQPKQAVGDPAPPAFRMGSGTSLTVVAPGFKYLSKHKFVDAVANSVGLDEDPPCSMSTSGNDAKPHESASSGTAVQGQDETSRNDGELSDDGLSDESSESGPDDSELSDDGLSDDGELSDESVPDSELSDDGSLQLELHRIDKLIEFDKFLLQNKPFFDSLYEKLHKKKDILDRAFRWLRRVSDGFEVLLSHAYGDLGDDDETLHGAPDSMHAMAYHRLLCRRIESWNPSFEVKYRLKNVGGEVLLRDQIRVQINDADFKFTDESYRQYMENHEAGDLLETLDSRGEISDDSPEEELCSALSRKCNAMAQAEVAAVSEKLQQHFGFLPAGSLDIEMKDKCTDFELSYKSWFRDPRIRFTTPSFSPSTALDLDPVAGTLVGCEWRFRAAARESAFPTLVPSCCMPRSDDKVVRVPILARVECCSNTTQRDEEAGGLDVMKIGIERRSRVLSPPASPRGSEEEESAGSHQDFLETEQDLQEASASRELQAHKKTETVVQEFEIVRISYPRHRTADEEKTDCGEEQGVVQYAHKEFEFLPDSEPSATDFADHLRVVVRIIKESRTEASQELLRILPRIKQAFPSYSTLCNDEDYTKWHSHKLTFWVDGMYEDDVPEKKNKKLCASGRWGSDDPVGTTASAACARGSTEEEQEEQEVSIDAASEPSPVHRVLRSHDSWFDVVRSVEKHRRTNGISQNKPLDITVAVRIEATASASKEDSEDAEEESSEDEEGGMEDENPAGEE